MPNGPISYTSPTQDDWNNFANPQYMNAPAPAVSAPVPGASGFTYNPSMFATARPSGPGAWGGGMVTPPGPGGDGGFGFNKDTLGAVSAGLGGLGKLASGWAALKGIGVAKDELAMQTEFARKNFAATKTTVNNRIRDQNAYKTAQGRTDLAKLIV